MSLWFSDLYRKHCSLDCNRRKFLYLDAFYRTWFKHRKSCVCESIFNYYLYRDGHRCKRLRRHYHKNNNG